MRTSNVKRDFARKEKLGLRRASGGAVGLPNLSLRSVGLPNAVQDAKARLSLRQHMADGGIISVLKNRESDIDSQIAGAQPATVPGSPPVNAPATPAAPPDTNVGSALRPGESPGLDSSDMALLHPVQPSIMQRIKAKLGLRRGGYVGYAGGGYVDGTDSPYFLADGGMPPAPENHGKRMRFVGSQLPAKLGMYGKGGKISGPGGPEADKIPAMLSNGEYVLPAKTVSSVGKDSLDQLVMQTNDGKPPAGAQRGLRGHYMTGGEVDPKEILGPTTTNPAGGTIYSGAAPGTAVNPNDPFGGGTSTFDAARAAAASNDTSLPGFQPEGTGPVARGLRAVGASRVGQAASAVANGPIGTAAKIGGELYIPGREALHTADVALNPNDSGLDVATQAAAGAGRAGAAFVGGAEGAAAGTAVFPGPGTIIGGAIGGYLGYKGADLAIKAGRSAVGTETADPYDRTAPIAPGQSAAAQTGGNGLRAAPVQPAANTPSYDPYTPGSPAFEAQFSGRTNHGEEAVGKAIDTAYSRDPMKGVSGGYFSGGGDQYAGNVASILQDRGKARALLTKYGTDVNADVARENSMRQYAINAARLHYDMNQDAQKRLQDNVDRASTIATTDKNGNITGNAIDPAQRNAFESYVRDSTSGYDTMDPEHQAQAAEHARHGFMLNQLANSGDYGTIGKFLSGWAVNRLGTPSSAPANIKAIRPLNASDFLQKGVGPLNIMGQRPYVEFDNGKLYPLAQAMQNREYQQALESRLQFAPKSVQEQYRQYVGRARVSGAQ